MLLKLGVDISRLNREIRRTLKYVDEVSRQITNEEAVITSTYEGTHQPNSLHYANDAYDIRAHQETRTGIADRIKRHLGNNFDVVLETDHIHIEYDPK